MLGPPACGDYHLSLPYAPPKRGGAQGASIPRLEMTIEEALRGVRGKAALLRPSSGIGVYVRPESAFAVG
jgi:hypothetical protein